MMTASADVLNALKRWNSTFASPEFKSSFMMAVPLMNDCTWLQQNKYEEAEALYQRVLAGTQTAGSAGETKSSNKPQGSTLKSEIAQARQNIQKALNELAGIPKKKAKPQSKSAPAVGDTQVMQRIKNLESENSNLKKVSADLTDLVKKLEARIVALEKANSGSSPAASSSAPAAKKKQDSDSDFDFGDSDDSDDESDDEEKKAKLEAYWAKKSKKPKVIAKSSLLLDVKPWDDETDMKKLEECVRSITMDGLLWGAAKLVPVGYGIKKLQINAVIEDDKVSTDDLEEQITAFEDYIQSMDIAAFNKI